MKALFSREYYAKNWDRFIRPVPGENYINLSEELSRAMKIYEGAELNGQALWIIERIEARKIIDRAEALVRRQMAVLQRLEAGESSLGYTTQAQEIHARGELRTRFEFNCYQLSLFREKYKEA